MPTYEETVKYAWENYGSWAMFLTDPEIGNLIYQAGDQRWSATELTARIRSTPWYQAREQAVREYDLRQTIDPAQNRALINAKQAELTDQMRQMGMWSNQIDVGQLATSAVRFGWNAAQVRDYMAVAINRDAINTVGTLASTAAHIRELGQQYHVVVSDGDQEWWAKQVAAGNVDPTTIEDHFKTKAKARYAWLAPQIDAGITVRAYFDQHRAVLGETLERNADAFDLMGDPRWRQVTEKIDEKTGQPRAMTLNEVRQFAKKQAEWRNTDQAKTAAANMAMSLAETFGKSG